MLRSKSLWTSNMNSQRQSFWVKGCAHPSKGFDCFRPKCPTEKPCPILLLFFLFSSFLSFFHFSSNCHTAPVLPPLRSLHYIPRTVRWPCFCSSIFLMFLIPLILRKVWGRTVYLIINLHFCVFIRSPSFCLARSLDCLSLYPQHRTQSIFSKCLLNEFRRK